jgi:hypothetical protein
MNEVRLDYWDTLAPTEAAQLAQSTVAKEAHQMDFVEVRRCGKAESRRYVAIFQWNHIEFAFIPGSTVSLGYDPNDPFEPDEGQLDDWDSFSSSYGGPVDLHRALKEILTPFRTVTIGPMLMQVEAQTLGLEEVPARARTEGFWPFQRTIKEFAIRRERCISYDEAIETVGRDDFRLPTSDEWEYACGAASRTLFAWGNHCPEDVTVEAIAEMRSLNSFGLSFWPNRYHWEFCQERGIARGGDGGGIACGGATGFTEWLTFAPAYIQKYDKRGLGCGSVRRVSPLRDC